MTALRVAASTRASSRSPRSALRRRVVPVLAVLAVAWICTVSIALAGDPGLAFCAAIAPVALALVATVPWVRLVVVIGGSLAVLGGSSEIGVTKIAYTALLLLCTGVSAVALYRARPAWVLQFRVLVVPGVLFAAILGIGLVVSPTPFDATNAIRNGVFWLMILAAPILGLDAARSLSPRAADWIVAAAGLLSAIGFATEWLARRGATNVALDQGIAGNFALPALAFSLAFVQSTRGKIRYRLLLWAPLATAILIALLITGTRTNLIAVIAVIGTLGPARLARVPIRKALISVGMIAAIAALITPFVITVAISNPEFLASRLLALTNTTGGGLQTDSSYVMRQAQTFSAQVIAGRFPLFGYGFGWAIPADQIFDTPWITVVRIGWVGVAGLVLFLVGCIATLALSARARPSYAYAVGSGVGTTFLVLLALLSPVEDHFFGFALALVFLLVGASLRAQPQSGSAPTDLADIVLARLRGLGGRRLRRAAARSRPGSSS